MPRFPVLGFVRSLTEERTNFQAVLLLVECEEVEAEVSGITPWQRSASAGVHWNTSPLLNCAASAAAKTSSRSGSTMCRWEKKPIGESQKLTSAPQQASSIPETPY